jgi:hypothetical protein
VRDRMIALPLSYRPSADRAGFEPATDNRSPGARHTVSKRANAGRRSGLAICSGDNRTSGARPCLELVSGTPGRNRTSV